MTREEARFFIARILSFNFDNSSYFAKNIFLEKADKFLDKVSKPNYFGCSNREFWFIINLVMNYHKITEDEGRAEFKKIKKLG